MFFNKSTKYSIVFYFSDSGVYLQLFIVFDLILDIALHHNRAQLSLVSQLISGKLYVLSTFRINEEKETFLMKFLNLRNWWKSRAFYGNETPDVRSL